MTRVFFQWSSVVLLMISVFHPIIGTAKEDGSHPISRCGWFDNPTPGNASLWDADGEWTVNRQGGYEAKGDWPRFGDRQKVLYGVGSYGFGCACLKGLFNNEKKMIIRIISSETKSLAACRHDPHLVGVEKKLK